MSETTLLTADALSRVGARTELLQTEVTADRILRYAASINETNPIHLSEEAAVQRGYRGLVAPPLMYQILGRPIVDANALTRDGVTVDRRPPVGEGRGMAGAVEAEIIEPICAGDVVTGVKLLRDLTERVGRSRVVVVATWETEYSVANQVVVREIQEQLLF